VTIIIWTWLEEEMPDYNKMAKDVAPGVLALYAKFLELDGSRIGINERMTALSPEDPSWDMLWVELEAVLARLREIVDRIADTPAINIAELRAKAVVLATRLRSGDEPEKALALSLSLSLSDDDDAHRTSGFRRQSLSSCMSGTTWRLRGSGRNR
jgi:hypothetical protein